MVPEFLGAAHITQTVATGDDFFQFEERGATHTGCLLATIDEEMGKIGPYFILALGSGPATAFGLAFVWPDFRSQRHPPW
jgi:hypothetical protein